MLRRSRIVEWLSVLALGMLLGCPPSNSGTLPKGEVSGVLMTYEDHQMVSSANVTIRFVQSGFSKSVQSDGNGFFMISELPLDGPFIVEAVQNNLGLSGTAESSISDALPQSSIIVLLDKPGTGQISGEVIGSDGLPVVGAIVTYHFPETDRQGTTETDVSGNYSFSSVHTDGTVIVVATNPVTGETASASGFLIADVAPAAEFFLQLQPIGPVQSTLNNGSFNNSLENWIATDDTYVVPREQAFGEGSAKENGCPQAMSAVINTAGSKAFGALSQTFTVPPGHRTLSGRVRFLSDEWPAYFGSEFNDSYVVRLTTPGGSHILASGNLNSSVWSPSAWGYSGQAPQVAFSIDVSQWVGKNVTIHFGVYDVGDEIVDSALAISDVKLVRTDQYVQAGTGSLNGAATITAQLGQAVRLTFKNVNILGTTIKVSSGSQFHQAIILPQQTMTFTFATFGSEPMGWSFDVDTDSDAFIVGYSIESTWVPGMPPNPCY